MSDKWIKILSSFGYAGYFPVASGTFASAVGLLICYLLHDNLAVYSVVLVVITALGFMFSGQMERIEGQKDPSAVVIDEVAGMMIAMYAIPFTSWKVVLIAFFLFRACDMFKVYPAGKFEQIHGGAGIMLDDVIAGVYTNIVMQIALRYTGLY